jgi:hypothetical protein
MNSELIFSKSSVGIYNRLRIAFNSCARFVFNTPRGEHISHLTEKILGLPLNKFYSYRICCQMFKITNLLCPAYLTDKIRFGHSTRTRILHILPHSLTSTANSFFVRGPAMWNSLPISVRTESREGKFRAVCWGFLESTALPIFN